MIFRRGDFAQLNGKVCVVVGLEGEQDVPEEHLALWFGNFYESDAPEVWTVPAEYVLPIDSAPVYRH